MFGGLVILSERLSGDKRASMKTNRELEWKAWEEKPRSMSATVT